jgi:hypothetical protein
VGDKCPNGKDTPEGVPVQSIARELDRGEDSVLYPRTKRPVDESDEVVCAGGRRIRISVGTGTRGEGKRWAEVDETAGEFINIVGEGIADGYDDGIELLDVDGLAAFDVFGCGEAVGVAVGDVPNTWCQLRVRG